MVDDEGGGARRRRPVHRPVRVGARRLLGEHVEDDCLVGGAMPPKVSTSTSRVMAFLTQLARAGELSQSLRVLRACLLMFSASPATAAMEICCVW